MPKRRPVQNNPLVRVTPTELDVSRYSAPAPGQEARWRKWATRFGLDPTLTGKARYEALEASLRPAKVDRQTRNAANLAHMNALLDAVEGGRQREFRPEPIRSDEIAAAYRATGRKPPRLRQAGDDFEEDAA